MYFSLKSLYGLELCVRNIIIFDIRSDSSFIWNVSNFGLFVHRVKILHVPIKETFVHPNFIIEIVNNEIVAYPTNRVNFSFQPHYLLLLKRSSFLRKGERIITSNYAMSPTAAL